MSWNFAKPQVSITHGDTLTCTLRANTVCEYGPWRHCGASEAAQQSGQQRVEILKSLEETSSLSDGLRNFM
jgi:hypothetical protein